MPGSYGCIILVQIGPKCHYCVKRGFRKKLANVTFVNLLPHHAKIFLKKLCDRSRDIRLNNFGPNWYQVVLLIEKGKNWTQITHLTLKRTFMKNWLMLTLSTLGIYPHHNTTMFKKIINANHKIQGCILFRQIGRIFFGKIDNSYFC